MTRAAGPSQRPNTRAPMQKTNPLRARRADLRTIRHLLPHLWPRQPAELRIRVVAALGCLIVAKLTNVYVPLLYKHAVDALTPHGNLLLVAPIAMIVAYGLLRVMAQTFGEI